MPLNVQYFLFFYYDFFLALFGIFDYCTLRCIHKINFLGFADVCTYFLDYQLFRDVTNTLLMLNFIMSAVAVVKRELSALLYLQLLFYVLMYGAKRKTYFFWNFLLCFRWVNALQTFWNWLLVLAVVLWKRKSKSLVHVDILKFLKKIEVSATFKLMQIWKCK